MILSASIAMTVSAEDFAYKIPLDLQRTGNYYLTGTLGSETEVEFMVDTGAGIAIFAESTFDSLAGGLHVKPNRRIAARMADGRTKAINVYKIERFSLGEGCKIGPAEVAVIPGAANNILGLNVLNRAAPFAIYTSPPSLALSVCLSLLTGSTPSTDVAVNFR